MLIETFDSVGRALQSILELFKGISVMSSFVKIFSHQLSPKKNALRLFNHLLHQSMGFFARIRNKVFEYWS